MSAYAQFREITKMLVEQPQEKVREFIATMTAIDLLRWDVDFESWIREGQQPPKREGWRTWLMMAGRGFGKTRAGSEWITGLATGKARPVRIALVGATDAEVRRVMVEGESGLIAVGERRRRRPSWEPSLGRLRWPGGSIAEVFSGENPERLRGPQHHFAWCDELAKWAAPEATWDNLQMTLRAGPRPRALVTTTPRPIPLLKRIGGEPWTVATGGRTGDNVTLPNAFLDVMAATYGGTRIGRQELNGELVEDVEGALWTRRLIERSRVPLSPTLSPDGEREYGRVVIGVDPPASAAGDACGIVACGVGADGLAYVLADHSVRGLSPEGWARAVAEAHRLHRADRIVVEKNMGGDMVESVLRGAAINLPVKGVSASRGKAARAEPVATLFEKGRARFAGAFPELEDELAGLLIGGGYQGPGQSPDRGDAMVWAMTELMLQGEKAEPRVRVL